MGTEKNGEAGAKQAGAIISDCGKYRYSLWRSFPQNYIICDDLPGGLSGKLVWIMLNPSTADYRKDDQTIKKCLGFTAGFGYQTMEVVNLFAYRATNPKEMLKQADPIGSENDFHIRRAITQAGLVICAWGPKGTHRFQSQKVLRVLRKQKIKPMALIKTQSGEPGHPLMLAYSTELIPMEV